jgi:hypothetical protein
VCVQVVGRRAPRERVERPRAYEPVCFGRDEWEDIVAAFDEQPNELARLIGGDASGHPDEDPGHGTILPVSR